jgi:hypothetical protein
MEIESVFSFSVPHRKGLISFISKKLRLVQYRGESVLSSKECICICYPNQVWLYPRTRNVISLIETVNHEVLHGVIFKSGYHLEQTKDHFIIHKMLFEDRQIIKWLKRIIRFLYLSFTGFSILTSLVFYWLITYVFEIPLRRVGLLKNRASTDTICLTTT